MKTSAPHKVTLLIALVLGVLGIVAELVTIPVLSSYAFVLVAVAFVLLLLGSLLKGM